MLAKLWSDTKIIMKSLLPVILAIAFYLTTLYIAYNFTNESITSAAIAAVVITMTGLLLRVGHIVHYDINENKLRVYFITALILSTAFIAGQLIATLIYAKYGSADFDAVTKIQNEANPIIMYTTALLLAPIGEEMLMRGIVYENISKVMPIPYAAAISASIFAVLHGNIIQTVATFLLGMALAYIYEIFGKRIIAPIIGHILFNICALSIQSITIPTILVAFIVVITTAIFFIALHWSRELIDPRRNLEDDMTALDIIERPLGEYQSGIDQKEDDTEQANIAELIYDGFYVTISQRGDNKFIVYDELDEEIYTYDTEDEARDAAKSIEGRNIYEYGF